MGREIRRVPLDWQHPKNEQGHYMPMLDKTHEDAMAEFVAEGWGDEDRPNPKYYRPKWDDNAVLGWCMYEDVSEGTPMTPVFETPELLADHLVEHHGMSKERALEFIEMGWLPSGVYSPKTGFQWGLDALNSGALDNE